MTHVSLSVPCYDAISLIQCCNCRKYCLLIQAAHFVPAYQHFNHLSCRAACKLPVILILPTCRSLLTRSTSAYSHVTIIASKQTVSRITHGVVAGRFKENEGSVQSHSFDGPPLRQNGVNRAQYMSNSLSGEKLKVKPSNSPCHPPTPGPPKQSPYAGHLLDSGLLP